MNRTLSSGVGCALAVLGIFSCSGDSLTGTNGLSTDDLSADASVIASVTVSFGASSIAVGDTTTAKATLRDRRGRILMNRVVTWSSSDNAVATVSTAGLVTGTGEGTAVITAARAGKSGSATITVTSIGTTTAGSVASVTVSLVSAALNPGQTTQASATMRDSANNVLSGRAVSWSSSNSGVATVSGTGLVTAVAVGTSQITATSEGKSGSAGVSVTTGSSITTNPGTVQNLAVTGIDSTAVTLSFTQVDDGAGQPAKYEVRFAAPPISWGSAPEVTSGSCATPLAGTAVGSPMVCSAQGLKPSTSYNFQVLAFRGTLNQDAVFGSLSNVAAATTTASSAPPPVPVATVSISPASVSIEVGATAQLTATTRDANNNVLTGRTITWASANTSLATVSASGLVTAKAAGTVQITATSEGKSAAATVAITAAPPPPPPGSSNEPAGMTFIDERAFDSPTDPAWYYSDGITIVSDASAPKSPSNIGRLTYDAGFPSGSAPGHTDFAFGSRPRHTVYVSHWGRFSSNWYGEASGTNKICYFWADGNLVPFFVSADGSGTSPLEPVVKTQALIVPAGNTNYGPNLVPSAHFTRGQWFHLEIIATGNSSGRADGSIDLYLDGVHVTSITGLQFTSGATLWSEYRWYPVWGGNNGPSLPVTQWQDADHIYISGKN